MTTSGLPVYDACVTYGADPTASATANQSAIQNAINDARNATGGIVFISKPGSYQVSNSAVGATCTLELKGGVTLMGVPGGAGANTLSFGTILEPQDSSIPFIQLDAPCTVENILFNYTTQNYTTPIPYPPTLYEVQNSRGGLILRNLLLYNPWIGISLGAAAGASTSGRNLLENIYIDPLSEGIVVDHTADVTRMNNIHFWDFNNAQHTYSLAHAVCLHVYHAFSLQITNMFAQGMHAGLSLEDSADTTQGSELTSYGQICNFYTDNCGYGISAKSTYSPNSNGSPGWTIANYYLAGSSNSVAGVALSPGGATGQYNPSIQIIGGSIWGSFTSGTVSLGTSSDHFRAVDWLGYN